MMHQQPAPLGTIPGTLSPSHTLRSARSPYRVLRLAVAAMMAALISLISLAAISPALPARTQMAALPAISPALPARTQAAALPAISPVRSYAAALPARAQTAALAASHTPRPLLSKPELVHLRSSYASHYDLGNGRRLAVVGAAPLNYQDAEGTWQPIQPGFAPVEGGWRVAQNTLRSTFANDSTAVQLESEGQVFGWQPVALEIDDGAGRARQLAVPQAGEAVQAEGLGSLLRYTTAWSDPTLVEQFQSSAGRLEQELILAQAPAPAGEEQWLSLRVDLALPAGVQIVANGQAQTGEFTTYGAVEFQQSDGAPLLALIPPQAFEQADRSVAVGGRYRVAPRGEGLSLWVQTPLAWWLAAERSYPAVLDPTMQVLRAIEAATIGYPYDEDDPDAGVAQQACVGMHDQEPLAGAWLPESKWYDRGYVKFKLPNLPDGAVATKATLVGAPEPRNPAEKGSLRASCREHHPLECADGPLERVGHPPSGQLLRSGRLVSPPARGDQGFRPHL